MKVAGYAIFEEWLGGRRVLASQKCLRRSPKAAILVILAAWRRILSFFRKPATAVAPLQFLKRIDMTSLLRNPW